MLSRLDALLCLSGGWDSSLLALIEPWDRAIFFDYGQPAVEEERAAVRSLIDHLGRFSDYIEARLPPIQAADDIYPCRNALFLTTAAAYAVEYGCNAVTIGANQSDWEHFPDCRPAFFNHMRAAFEAAKYPVRIRTPLLYKGKVEIMRSAREHGLENCWTCYRPKDGEPCGECRACVSARRSLEKA